MYILVNLWYKYIILNSNQWFNFVNLLEKFKFNYIQNIITKILVKRKLSLFSWNGNEFQKPIREGFYVCSSQCESSLTKTNMSSVMSWLHEVSPLYVRLGRENSHLYCIVVFFFSSCVKINLGVKGLFRDEFFPFVYRIDETKFAEINHF